MSDCTSIDPLVTPYIDGELLDSERRVVEAHLERCPPCRTRVSAERSACDLLKSRKAELCRTLLAPPALRAHCASARPQPGVVPFRPPPPMSAARPFRVRRLAVAATFLLMIAGGLAYRATLGATEAMAAELAADHVKCFMLNTVLRTHESISDVEAYLRSGFAWEAELPPAGAHPVADRDTLDIVGARPCFYEHGKVAHIMYRHRGVPVSVFMLPGAHHEHELVHVFGHEAVIWADAHRTFVLIAKAPRAEVEKVAAFVQASLR